MDNPTLLGQVRRKLNVTWDDDETTARIDEIMESAVPDLKHRLYKLLAPDIKEDGKAERAKKRTDYLNRHQCGIAVAAYGDVARYEYEEDVACGYRSCGDRRLK